MPPQIKIQAFGGMIPVRDARLLPDNNASDAANVWTYSGSLESIRVPRDIHELVNPAARYAFRVPKGAEDVIHIEDSYWLEFEDISTTVVKSPVRGSEQPSYYWANATAVPGYTTLERIAAGDPELKLGIPAPGVAPVVVPSGGVAAEEETRAYVYTWVSKYGEEGPPSPPFLVTGKLDDTWAVTLTAPSGGDTTGRVLEDVRIYRTVTSAQGVAVFYLVTDQVIADLTYDDTLPADTIIGQGQLLSTTWTAPPEDLQGIVAMANGMLVGWRNNEVWFCEPYRPHAWPAEYVQLVDYDVVGAGTFDQSIIIGTKGYPFFATGSNPVTVTLRRIAAAEPCVSRGSIVATPAGVYYASPNGLIFAVPGAAQNVTRNFISKDKWAELVNLPQLRAALINEAYYAFSGVVEGVFQSNAFQNDAFQQEDFAGTRDGVFLDMRDERVGLTKLEHATPTYNVLQDVWTGELLLIRDGQVKLMDVTYDLQDDYRWASKIFTLPKPQNLGAVKFIWEPPLGGVAPTGTMKTYADGVLVQTKNMPPNRQVFRLPSAFKATNYQFVIEANFIIKSIEVGATVKDLQNV